MNHTPFLVADGLHSLTACRVDQLDKCNECDSPVLRREERCGYCKSTDIIRKKDSKWLFTIRSKDDLKTLIDNPNLDRILLIIDDYPSFDDGNFDDIRIQIFEIYPKRKRHKRFKEIMTNYYYKIYLEHKRKNPEKTPAPKNFWPYQYQFYLCNPILIFKATIKGAYTENVELVINEWIEPQKDRDKLNSIIMPPSLLKKDEFKIILKKAKKIEVINCLIDKKSFPKFEKMVNGDEKLKEIQSLFSGIDESLRGYLDLRDMDKISTAKKKYTRKTHG